MKYLLTYVFDGEQGSGQGSVIMTTNTNKITTELIANAVEWVKHDFAEKGMKINRLAPMGWYKFDEEPLPTPYVPDINVGEMVESED